MNIRANPGNIASYSSDDTSREDSSPRSSEGDDMAFRNADTDIEELRGSSPRFDKSDMEFHGAERTDAQMSNFFGRTISIDAHKPFFFQRARTSSTRSQSSEGSFHFRLLKAPSTGTREEIISRGDLLSVADFKKVEDKVLSLHGPTYHELISGLRHYENNHHHWSPKQHLEELTRLEEKATTYMGKKLEDAQKPSSKERTPEMNATTLLLAGIHNKKIEVSIEMEPWSASTMRLTEPLPSHVQHQEAITQEVMTALEALSPTAYTVSIANRVSLPEQPQLSPEAIAKRDLATEHLISSLMKPEEEALSPEQLPRLLDQKHASALKSLAPEQLETILKKYDVPAAEIKNTQARLVRLQKYIDTVQKITRMNEAKAKEGVQLDVGTQDGFKTYFQNATRNELEELGSYRPAEHLEGAAIVTNWNSVA